MHQQTPLGSHPDIEKPRVPQSLQLCKVLILLANVYLIVWQMLSTGTVSNFAYGLTALGASLVLLIDTKYTWRNRSYRILNLSFLAIFVFSGLYFISKP